MRPRRRGYTLIECSVVIVLVTATLSTATLTLHWLYRGERRLRDELERERALQQFAVQLRSDAHQALSATAGGPAGKTAADLLLTLPGDETVQYTLLPQGIDRVVRRAERTSRRETYRLLSSAALWQVRQDRNPPIVSLVLDLRSDGGARRAVGLPTCRIDAALQPAPPRLPLSAQ
jgi:prepilin-type N-terminal cleavage/methylation domain-containing protein